MTTELVVLLALLLNDPSIEKPPLQTVAAVDLQRYAGTWYEIGRYPNRFQKKCATDVTATYTLRSDGKLDVLNSCRKANGERLSAKGTAKVSDPSSKAKLRVTFFWPFYGDYWVIGLDPAYQWVVIGQPSRKYLWILSRTPVLPAQSGVEVRKVIEGAGYDARLVQQTTHTPEPRTR